MYSNTSTCMEEILMSVGNGLRKLIRKMVAPTSPWVGKEGPRIQWYSDYIPASYPKIALLLILATIGFVAILIILVGVLIKITWMIW